ncbi:hypothetical protein GH714_018989 [Hevea brasiliensis]|uniref:RING-type domain-containing protein n=1 Tax=Hevea brasiliensis TaxID=3981 RepID=A0A6A6K9F6_HEVBR|nr:hypothetical protein GH714_018989 [Hevea brasiliensis]
MKLQETPPELCAVCLSELAVDENVRDLKCKHVFHKLDKWLLQCRSTCPLRRTKLLPDEMVAGYRLLKDDQMGIFSGQHVFTTTQFLSYLEQMNPGVRYTKLLMKLQETPPELCAVCLSEFAVDETVRDLKCKHVFHKDCLDKWLLQCRSTCPLCRTKLLPDEVVAGYRRLKDDQIGYDRSNEEIVFLVSHGNGFSSF